MPLIKRYPNRKLYDTQAKQYITLEGIAALIRQGQDVHVVDYTNGEDLTAVTLTQIIFEQEKKKSGFVPQSVLTGLVQAGGETLGTLRRTLSSPLDLARQVDEEIERRIRDLMGRGELASEDGDRLSDKLLARTRQTPEPHEVSDLEIEHALAERGVPTSDDLDQVLRKLESLGKKLDQLNPPSEPKDEL